MDELNVQELISMISDVVRGLSAMIVAILGFLGFSQWRRELSGKTKFQIARKLAILATKYRDKINYARSIITYSGESSDRKKEDSETTGEANILDEYYARQKRALEVRKSLRNLLVTKWEAEIVLDKDIEKYLLPLVKLDSEYQLSLEMYFETLIGQENKTLPTAPEDFIKSNHKIIYGTEDDEFSLSVKEATTTLVNKLKSYIE